MVNMGKGFIFWNLKDTCVGWRWVTESQPGMRVVVTLPLGQASWWGVLGSVNLLTWCSWEAGLGHHLCLPGGREKWANR